MKRTSTGCLVGAESGQASVLLVLILGTFLLASVAFAVDLSNMWFRRQAAQTAADASCAAGAMDMLYLNNGTLTTSPGFTPGTAGDCNSSSTAAICQYAGFNGYTATTSASGWGTSTPSGAVAVNWTFPAANSVTGVKAAGGVANPFLKVVVQENVSTWFMGMLGRTKQTVAASCTCGLTPGPQLAPLIILNPTVGEALLLTGGSHIVITGGPQTSIQVNSSANGSPSTQNASNAVHCTGGSGFPIDTSAAGPLGTGGDLAVLGGPTTNLNCGSSLTLNNTTNAKWKSPSPAVPDPFGSVAPPTQPPGMVPAAVTPVATVAQGYTPTFDPTYGYIYGTWVASGTDSCPNTAAHQHFVKHSSSYPLNGGDIWGNCLEFNPGYYPNGIDTSSLAVSANDVVIFMPGIYYLNGDLTVASGTTVRNAWVGTQPATQGVMFYFKSGGPLFAGGSGGASSAVVSSVPSYYMNCSGTTTPSVMPASLNGNVLVSQCTSGGTYFGAGSSDSLSATGLRGLLFYSGPANTFNGTVIGNGASMAFSGALYFHNKSTNLDLVELDGAGASTTYAIGTIVVDRLKLSGSGTIKMGLLGASNPGPPVVGLFQ